jgi:ribosomal protein L33
MKRQSADDRSVRQTPADWIRLAACNSCAHKRYRSSNGSGNTAELVIVEVVMVGLRCTQCRGYRASVLMLKLSEPGYPRQR